MFPLYYIVVHGSVLSLAAGWDLIHWRHRKTVLGLRSRAGGLDGVLIERYVQKTICRPFLPCFLALVTPTYWASRPRQFLSFFLTLSHHITYYCGSSTTCRNGYDCTLRSTTKWIHQRLCMQLQDLMQSPHILCKIKAAFHRVYEYLSPFSHSRTSHPLGNRCTTNQHGVIPDLTCMLSCGSYFVLRKDNNQPDGLGLQDST